MLTLEELRRQLTRVTYKPGYTFTVWQHPWEGVWLTMTAELLDAYHPDKTITVRVNTAVPPIPHGRYLFEWLCYRLARFETHECREWFRVDDQPVFDPHSSHANDEPQT
jgi:hypothetical protein